MRLFVIKLSTNDKIKYIYIVSIIYQCKYGNITANLDSKEIEVC